MLFIQFMRHGLGRTYEQIISFLEKMLIKQAREQGSNQIWQSRTSKAITLLTNGHSQKSHLKMEKMDT